MVVSAADNRTFFCKDTYQYTNSEGYAVLQIFFSVFLLLNMSYVLLLVHKGNKISYDRLTAPLHVEREKERHALVKPSHHLYIQVASIFFLIQFFAFLPQSTPVLQFCERKEPYPLHPLLHPPSLNLVPPSIPCSGILWVFCAALDTFLPVALCRRGSGMAKAVSFVVAALIFVVGDILPRLLRPIAPCPFCGLHMPSSLLEPVNSSYAAFFPPLIASRCIFYSGLC